MFKQGDVTLQARKDLLHEQLATIVQRLDEIQHTYDLIKDKADHYEAHVEGYHGKLAK
ncbi:MerR family transcriptional regulator [Levilactobacillus lindianensis]|uniref:hypothetical protein n=1 Tax=Levilactobacillus lindianensis TaxID=2486018 RepID=UPI001CDCD1A9|nr:hypothetical protein [Levilactobacillus lindianensis]